MSASRLAYPSPILLTQLTAEKVTAKRTEARLPLAARTPWTAVGESTPPRAASATLQCPVISRATDVIRTSRAQSGGIGPVHAQAPRWCHALSVKASGWEMTGFAVGSADEGESRDKSELHG